MHSAEQQPRVCVVGACNIIIVTGANDLLTPAEIEAARADVAAADVFVCQLEIPIEMNLAALRPARAEGVTTIFNPALSPRARSSSRALRHRFPHEMKCWISCERAHDEQPPTFPIARRSRPLVAPRVSRRHTRHDGGVSCPEVARSAG
jgi:hypothetical protein